MISLITIKKTANMNYKAEHRKIIHKPEHPTRNI